ncbi:MAG TPA: hypothetical protein VM536_00580 [Chloroflexia bacterium]|nr:hypothetical protein [Chloroflexia bacterium]
MTGDRPLTWALTLPAGGAYNPRRMATRLPRSLVVGFLGAALLGVGNALAHGWLIRELPRGAQPDPFIALGIANAVLLLGAGVASSRVPGAAWERALPLLLAAVALPLLANIWVQATWTSPKGGLVFGTTLDPDMGLYYCYGRQALGLAPTPEPPCDNPAFGEGRVPLMEYPQGALALFTAGAALAGASADAFRVGFALILTGFTLGSVALLFALGRRAGNPRLAVFLSLVVTISPFLMRLAPVRYDIVPTFFLLLGAYLLVAGPADAAAHDTARLAALAGIAVAAGALLKWLPGLFLPFVAGYYLRRGDRRAGLVAVGAAGGLMLVVLAPFLLADPPRFFYAYSYQGSRELIGESAPFLLQYAVLDPAHSLPGRPWGVPPVVLLGNLPMTVVQVVLAALPLALAWRWARRRVTWAACGLMSVALFTLANRIFSPQFVLALGFTWAAALVLVRPGARASAVALLVLLGTGLANFLVFPLWPPYWPAASATLFALGFGLTGWILWRCVQAPDTAATPAPA